MLFPFRSVLDNCLLHREVIHFRVDHFHYHPILFLKLRSFIMMFSIKYKIEEHRTIVPFFKLITLVSWGHFNSSSPVSFATFWHHTL
jgi:hypothetical protein